MVGLGTIIEGGKKFDKCLLHVSRSELGRVKVSRPRSENLDITLAEHAESIRSKIASLVRDIEKEVDSQLTIPSTIEDEESIDNRWDIIDKFLPADKKAELVKGIGQELLDSSFYGAIDIQQQVKKAATTDDSVIQEKSIGALRQSLERDLRRTELIYPDSEDVFWAAVTWLAEQGELSDLETIRRVAANLPFKSDIIRGSMKQVQQKFVVRFAEQVGLYRVFCSEKDLLPFGEALDVVEYCEACIIVTASLSAITIVGKSFPVDCIRLSQESIPQPDPKSKGAQMKFSGNSKRDQIVRFKFPIKDAWKLEIEERFNARILAPLGGLKLAVAVPEQSIILEIKNLPYVEDVTPYIPEISVRMEYLEQSDEPVTKEMIAVARREARQAQATEPLSVRPSRSMPVLGVVIAEFFTEADRESAKENLSAQGIETISETRTRLVLRIPPGGDARASVETIARQVGLQSLGEKSVPKLSNDKARVLLLGEPEQPFSCEFLGLTGKGEIIAIADTGLDTGNPDSIHADIEGRVLSLESYPVSMDYKESALNCGDDDGPADKHSGHGTHVSGSALGNGTQAKDMRLPCVPMGVAPDAKLVFQSIEQTTEWNNRYIIRYVREHGGELPCPFELSGIPTDLGDMFQSAYDQGARIHSNSWGSAYKSAFSRDVSRFAWNHKDCLVVAAAGNRTRQHYPGKSFVSVGSIDYPGSAKNCLTVGATENDRIGEFSETYGERYPGQFPYHPYNKKGLVDSVDDVAAFSGRGPCTDGRRKPDVVAPGTVVLSTRSSRIASSELGCDSYPFAPNSYMYMSGTSMATPLVAGCVALVRQYLRKIYQPSIDAPSAALMKAAIIHSAQYIDHSHSKSPSVGCADNEQGWGRVFLPSILNPAPPSQVVFIDESVGLITDQKFSYLVDIADSSVPLKVTLVYTDAPSADSDEALINRLNLILYSPSGKYFIGNDFADMKNPDPINNVEGVVVTSPEIGVWRVDVTAGSVPEGPQDYAVVMSGGGLSQVL